MITLRRANDRGSTKLNWLDSRHTFSFGDYYDRQHMGFRDLRVINEDRVIPGKGFPTHSHRDMEIITYVLEGAVTHKDSTGTSTVIRPGDVQRMSAGTGVLHSEFNQSARDPVHFLQIWIEPNEHGVAPSYEQKNFADEQKRGRLRLIASPDGGEGSIKIHQDARVYVALLDGADAVSHALAQERKAYVHVARGTVRLNGTALSSGDGAKIDGERELKLSDAKDAEVLLFDLSGD
jgi:redox-sensitive bicupin YhaK (pirin superfamily)